MEERSPSSRRLVAAFCLVAALFWLVAFASQLRLVRIDALTADLANDSAPSVRHLAVARAALGDIGRHAFELAGVPDGHGDEHLQALRAAEAALHREIDAYRALPFSAEERPLGAATQERCDLVDRRIDAALQKLATPNDPATLALLQNALRGCGDSILAALDFNAAHVANAAGDIERTRISGVRLTFILVVLSSLLTVLAGWLTVRTVRRDAELRHAHAELLRTRAHELELFGGRLAHDVRNALAVTSMSLELMAHDATVAEKQAGAIERARRGVKRVQSMVDGLYEFAAAGARPMVGATANVDATLDDVLASLSGQAEAAHVELRRPAPSGAFVRCHEGVLTSILANLLINAIKYVGARADALVSIRVAGSGPKVRVEVEDNGPGIPAGMEDRIFDPYQRAADLARPGLGLGLATVKRLVERHQGGVGVDRPRHGGTIIWFELPSAPAAT